MTSTARVAVAAMRANGVAAGLLKLKALRPFPREEVREALANVPKVAVIDRNISLGNGGIWCQELKSALYGMDRPPVVTGYIAGICGADVSPDMIEQMALDALSGIQTEKLLPFLIETSNNNNTMAILGILYAIK